MRRSRPHESGFCAILRYRQGSIAHALLSNIRNCLLSELYQSILSTTCVQVKISCRQQDKAKIVAKAERIDRRCISTLPQVCSTSASCPSVMKSVLKLMGWTAQHAEDQDEEPRLPDERQRQLTLVAGIQPQILRQPRQRALHGDRRTR